MARSRTRALTLALPLALALNPPRPGASRYTWGAEGPENRSRRTCSGAGPARPSPYAATQLASRPLPVPRIPTDSPPYAIAPPAPKTRAEARAQRAKPGANAPPSPSEARGAEGPENRSRRTCSGAGPARPSPYAATQLASRPLPVPRIPTDSPPYAIAPPRPQDTRGSASPKGEARRERAAKPKRSTGRGGRTTGGGGRVDLTKTSRRQSRFAGADTDADAFRWR